MYNQILIVLIFVSLIMLINYYSLYINYSNEETPIENIVKEKLEEPKIPKKKVRFQLDNFVNNKTFDITRPQNSNDFIKYKDIDDIEGDNDIKIYNNVTNTEFININYDEVERISGKPYEHYKIDEKLRYDVEYESYDKDTINNISFDDNSKIKPYYRLGIGSKL